MVGYRDSSLGHDVVDMSDSSVWSDWTTAHAAEAAQCRSHKPELTESALAMHAKSG